MADGEPNIAPEELDTQRRRAFVAAGLGWGLDGFDWTMFAFALPAITAALSLSASDGPFIVAVSLVASAFGGVIGGTLADRYGRVRVLTFVILGYSLFTALTATAQNFEQLLLWRTLHGFTFGAEWAVGAALLAEYADPERRGRTMGLLQSTYAIGWAASTAAYLILFDAMDDEVAWRYLFLLGILPAAAAFFIRLTVKDRVRADSSERPPLSLPRLFRPDIRRTAIIATLFGVGGQGTYYWSSSSCRRSSPRSATRASSAPPPTCGSSSPARSSATWWPATCTTCSGAARRSRSTSPARRPPSRRSC